MTIHSRFWHERQFRHSFGIRAARDSKRQKCYNWEFETLRPHQATFNNRQAAKGFARLCRNIAVRVMVEKGYLNPDDQARIDVVKSSFTAAFTHETIGHCNANHNGAYFAKWGWTNVIIAHEVAHWADMWAHKLNHCQNFEPHGPKWRGWFVAILARATERLGKENTETLMRRTLAERKLTFLMP